MTEILDLFDPPPASMSRGHRRPDAKNAKAADQRARNLVVVRRAFDEVGDAGATPDEIAGRVGLGVLSVRPRCTQLLQLGHVERTGERRGGAWVLRRTAGFKAEPAA